MLAPDTPPTKFRSATNSNMSRGLMAPDTRASTHEETRDQYKRSVGFCAHNKIGSLE